jgi:ADP-ribose pyrophosphatase
MTQILSRKTKFTTPWFEVIAKSVAGESAPYYALRMQDYVTVVAFTPEGELVLVWQFRPAVERITLELPAGQVEKNETPAESARRELAEECGYDAPEMELLGTLISDAGRNENRLWCYLAHRVQPAAGGFTPEPGLERVLAPRSRILELMATAEFDHALHWAALMLALARHGARILG